jgi:hypothetical protein
LDRITRRAHTLSQLLGSVDTYRNHRTVAASVTIAR